MLSKSLGLLTEWLGAAYKDRALLLPMTWCYIQIICGETYTALGEGRPSTKGTGRSSSVSTSSFCCQYRGMFSKSPHASSLSRAARPGNSPAPPHRPNGS
jgi:hypothetical protein